MIDVSHLPSHYMAKTDLHLVNAELVANFRSWKLEAIEDDDPYGSTSVIVKALLCGRNAWLPAIYPIPLLAIARLHSGGPDGVTRLRMLRSPTGTKAISSISHPRERTGRQHSPIGRRT